MQAATQVEREVLTLAEVMTIVGYRSRTTINNLIKAGIFPPPIRLGWRRIGWRRDVIERWLDERAGVPATRGPRAA